MKAILALLVFSLPLPLMGQVSVYVFPQKQQIPVNGVQTFTAVVTGGDDKSVTWTTTCGGVIQGLNNTIGLVDSAERSCTVTATSSADKTKTASGTVTYVATPHFQEGVHPRLILTPKMVETMRTHGWATPANPYWKNGLAISAANAVAEVDSKWCFSFGGYCPQGAKRGEPLHIYAPTLYNPPNVTTLSRDASGTVTATLASPMEIWKGATLTLFTSTADQENFRKGPILITSILDGTHFTYKEVGHPGVSSATATLIFPCGRLNADTWCDTGGYKNPTFDTTETYAELFAFLALIDPDATNQARYRTRAHDMMMWMIDLAGDTGPQGCQSTRYPDPFRSCVFTINDRAHQAGMEAFPLTVDWIYSTFTTEEKKRITRVFRGWAHQLMTTGATGIAYPLPFGVMNDPALLSNPKQLRWQMNNLGDSQYRSATMLGLVMDLADDRPDTGTAANHPIVASKNDMTTSSLRDYSLLAEGAWTYIHWAVAEDPGIVAKALGVSTAGLGENQGGLSPESSEYGGNYGYVAMGLLSLHTAGADDPTHMPQMSFMSSSHWDLWIDGLFHAISPIPRTDKTGSFYDVTQYGDDSEGNFLSTEYIKLLMPLGLYDYYTRENPARLNAIRWLVKNALGTGCGSGLHGACGASSEFLYKRLALTIGPNTFNLPIYSFLLLDPTATPDSPTNPSGDIDPRPKYPTEFYAPGHHEMSARSGWQPDASWLVTHCSWVGIDHQHGNCGQTEFYRKGRWLTKAHAAYWPPSSALSMFNNSGLSIGNPDNAPSKNKDDIYYITAIHGAQYGSQGAFGFTPKPLFSSGSAFLYEYYDQTDTFNENHPSFFPTHDVAHASRSLLWLKPDILIYYDRGVSHSAGMFKRDNFNFPAEPTVTSQTAKVVDTVTKQQTFLTTLLPVAGNFSAAICAYGSKIGDCEGTTRSTGGDESAFLYQIEDKSIPMSAQFLSVMEGADADRPQTPTLLVQSSGTAMDGAVIGNSVVLFTKVPWRSGSAFSPTSYSVPIAAINHYIGGLEPNTAYGVEVSVNGGSLKVAVSQQCRGSCLKTDGAGLLEFNMSSAGSTAEGTKAYSK